MHPEWLEVGGAICEGQPALSRFRATNFLLGLLGIVETGVVGDLGDVHEGSRGGGGALGVKSRSVTRAR